MFHDQEGGVVGGDGDGLRVVAPSSQGADGASKGGLQLEGPLGQEVQGGDHHQGGAGGRGDGHLGQEGLAGARGEDHDSPPALPPPGLQGFLLIEAGLAGEGGEALQALIGPRLVVVGHPLPMEPEEDFGVVGGAGAEAAHAAVIAALFPDSRREGGSWGEGFVPHQEGSGLEA